MPPLETVDGADDTVSATIQNMRVDLSCPDIVMPQKFLHRSNVIARFEEMGREAVA